VSDIRWEPLRNVALVLGVSPEALRKRCERHSVLGADGATEARFDGVYARKLSGRWRAVLSAQWAEPPVIESSRQARERRVRGNRA
jgi:hypothetical protein